MEQTHLLQNYGPRDLAIVKGRGSWVWDDKDNRYLDCVQGVAVNAFGHLHPPVVAAIQDQLGKLMHASNLYVLEPQAKLADTLCGMAGMDAAFFCNSGTEAIEGALKFARCFTGRQDVVYCDHAFHGLTGGSLAVNGADFFRKDFGQPVPGTRMVPFNDLVALEKALATKTAAAFIVEPVQGKSCEVVADGYLAEAQRLCKKYGSLLIIDEVQSGLGRTGKWFCFQHWPDVEPDIVCTAKALSGGYVPVGAIITRPKVMDCVFNGMEKCVVHSNTFGQNDLAMAAALASLYVIEQEKLCENAAAMGEYVMTRLKEIGSTCPFVADVRGKGLMFGIDFKRPESGLKLKMAWDMLHKLNFGVFGQMIVIPLMQKHKILTQVAGYHTEVIKFLPPITVSREDMDWFLTAMQDVLAETQRVPGAAWNTVMGLAKRTMTA